MTPLELTLERDGPNRLVCTLAGGAASAKLTSWDPPAAVAILATALDDVEATGRADCVWPDETDDFRWLFRRSGDSLQVMILRSIGTMTGWEHVFWVQTDYAGFLALARRALERLKT